MKDKKKYMNPYEMLNVYAYEMGNELGAHLEKSKAMHKKEYVKKKQEKTKSNSQKP